MIAKLKEYFDPAVKNPVYICSTLLDPRIKATALTDTVLELINMTKQEVVRMFKDQAEQFEPSQYKQATNPDKEEDLANESRPSIDQWYQKKKPRVTSVQEEVTVYLNSEAEDGDVEPLCYWRCNKKKFPTLSQMAQTYLSVSASSTPCEQAFSIGRHIQDYTQNLMKTKTLELIICLQNWIDNEVVNISNTANLSPF
jgi:hypothetical protein